jgi:hypothetical protein
MIRARCTKSYCRRCHGNHQHIQNAGTSAARMRNIAIYNDQRLRDTQSPPKSSAKKAKIRRDEGTGFLSLPRELRTQIYSLCLEPDRALINGSVEGGGYHPDSFSRNFLLWASHRFPVAILLLCQAVNTEAKQEIYRLIKFRLEPDSPAQLSKVGYWLTKHPMHYTTSLEMPFYVCPRGLTDRGIPFRQNQKPKLIRDHVVSLSRMISHMPNLRQLDIGLFISNQVYMSHLSYEKQRMMFCLLFLLRDSLPERIQLRIIIDMDISFEKPEYGGQSANPKNSMLAESFLMKEGFKVLIGDARPLAVTRHVVSWRIWGEKREIIPAIIQSHGGNGYWQPRL